MDDEYDIDREMMIDFIDESVESLSLIPGLFVQLEQAPGDLSIIEAVFRPVHSLKGNAAYFGLLKTKALAHELESILDRLRKGKLSVQPVIIDTLLSGVDEILAILDATREAGDEACEAERYEAVMEQVVKQLDASTEAVESPIPQALVLLRKLADAPLLANTEEHATLMQAIDLLAAGTPEEEPAEEAPEEDATPDGPLASMMQILENPPSGLTKEQQAELVEACLKEMTELAETDAAQHTIAEALEEFDLFVSRIGFDDILRNSLIEKGRRLAQMQAWETYPGGGGAADEASDAGEGAPSDEPSPSGQGDVQPKPEKAESAAAEEQPAADQPRRAEEPAAEARKQDRGRTMRVSEDSIDAFLSFVGELIAVDEMFRYIHSELLKTQAGLPITSAFLRVINTFTKLSDDLQASIMEIRKVTVRTMLEKSRRIVRDVASSRNKRIDTVIAGDDLTIDRSLIETLEAPLVHMVRNAADHGIEPPAERAQTGKSETGVVTVTMTESEDTITLSIKDDGRGLDYEKIRQKALANGLLGPNDPVTEDLLVDFIFSSGFSTASAVTEISGRGVGMDAVKRAVEDAGGRMEVKTKPGQGTEFFIKLPATVGTQIMQSFVVQISEQRFVVPMDSISGSFRPLSKDLHRLPNGAVCVKRNGMIMPITHLDGPYYGEYNDLLDGILITVEAKSRPFAFFVDVILGLQKVVLRPVPWIDLRKYLGAAVMGDGQVSMIVDLRAIERQVE